MRVVCEIHIFEFNFAVFDVRWNWHFRVFDTLIIMHDFKNKLNIDPSRPDHAVVPADCLQWLNQLHLIELYDHEIANCYLLLQYLIIGKEDLKSNSCESYRPCHQLEHCLTLSHSHLCILILQQTLEVTIAFVIFSVEVFDCLKVDQRIDGLLALALVFSRFLFDEFAFPFSCEVIDDQEYEHGYHSYKDILVSVQVADGGTH